MGSSPEILYVLNYTTGDHLNIIWQPKTVQDLLSNVILRTFLKMIPCPYLSLAGSGPIVFTENYNASSMYYREGGGHPNLAAYILHQENVKAPSDTAYHNVSGRGVWI